MKSFYAHPQALIDEGVVIGEGTRVWAFAHLAKGSVVGRDCNICDHTFIERGVRIGDRVTLKCGVYLWDGITIEDDVFVGPNATFTNDLRPRSKKYPDAFMQTLLRAGCSIGAHASILPGLVVGRWAMVGAGTVVTRSVPDLALVAGNPGRLRGWVCVCGLKLGDFKSDAALCSCGRAYQMKADQTIEEKCNAT